MGGCCVRRLGDERREKSKEKPPVDRSHPPQDDASVPLTYGLVPTQGPTHNPTHHPVQSQPCPHCRHSYTESSLKTLPYATAGTSGHVEPSAPPREEGPDPYASPYATMCLQDRDGSGPGPGRGGGGGGVPVGLRTGGSGERNGAYARSQSESSGSTGSHYSACGRGAVTGPVYRSLSYGAPGSVSMAAAAANDRPTCPTCNSAAGGGACAPPTYDESQHHQVLPHTHAQSHIHPHVHTEPTLQEKC